MVKTWKFAPAGRPARKARISDKTRDNQEVDPWLKATLNAIRLGNSFLVLVNNPSSANIDRRHLDDQLAHIAVMQATIANNTVAGKEINALTDEVGYAPYTFSVVRKYYSGSNIQMAQSWEEDGMETLLPIRIYPPNSEAERRQAVLYGVGDQNDLLDLERTFLDFYEPSFHAVSFSERRPTSEGDEQTTEFFVQWELFPEEAAAALGVGPDSSEFEEIMDQLEQMSAPPRPPEPRGIKQLRSTADERWPDLGKYKNQGGRQHAD